MPNSPQSEGFRSVRRIKIHANIQIISHLSKISGAKSFTIPKNMWKNMWNMWKKIWESASGQAVCQRAKSGVESAAVSTAALRERRGMV